jgi:hypothetical protein
LTAGLEQWYRRQAIGIFRRGRTLPGVEEVSAGVHILVDEQVSPSVRDYLIVDSAELLQILPT